jgi:hypothetical protein
MSQEKIQEVLETLQKTAASPTNAKIVSVIGSCKTLGQLDSCKEWIDRVVRKPEEKLMLYMMANLQFGRIDCGIDI